MMILPTIAAFVLSILAMVGYIRLGNNFLKAAGIFCATLGFGFWFLCMIEAYKSI